MRYLKSNGSPERFESSDQGILKPGRAVALLSYHRPYAHADAGACPPCTTVAIFRSMAVLALGVMFCAPEVVRLRHRLPGCGLLPGSGYGEEPGVVVVPAGNGLVPPSPGGAAQREGEAGAGDQPDGVLPGEAGEPGGLGDRQLDGGDAGRGQGWPPRTGTGAPRGISRSASLISPSSTVSLVSCPVPGFQHRCTACQCRVPSRQTSWASR